MIDQTKIKYIDLTPSANGCRITLEAMLPESDHPILILNHVPVNLRHAKRGASSLYWADFPFTPFQLKLMVNDEILAQLDEAQLKELMEKTGFIHETSHAGWQDQTYVIEGRVMSPLLEPVKLSVQDEWGKELKAQVERYDDPDLAQAGLNIEDGFSMKIQPEKAREIWLTMEDSSQVVRTCLTSNPSVTDENPLEAAAKMATSNWRSSFYKLYNHFSVLNRINSYPNWFEKQKPDSHRLKAQREYPFRNKVKFSLVVPVKDTEEKHVLELIASVLNQTYDQWQLILMDGLDGEELKEKMETDFKDENRILYKKLDSSLETADLLNEGLKLVSGDYAGILEPDGLMTEDALFEAAKLVETNAPDFIYTDEDQMENQSGLWTNPHFKPDFDMDQLLNQNYIGHLYFMSRPLMDQTGLFDGNLPGAEEYDFLLRTMNHAQKVMHIPRILYHSRYDETLEPDTEKMDITTASGQKAIQNWLDDHSLKAAVRPMPKPYEDMYWLQPYFDQKPWISIITTHQNQGEALKRLYESLEKTGWDHFELLVLDLESTDAQSQKILNELSKTGKVRVMEKSSLGNLAEHLNDAAQAAKGDYLLFMNPTSQILHPMTLDFMVFKAMLPDHGAITGKILDHSSLVWGYGEIVDGNGRILRAFEHLQPEEPGHQGRALVSSHYQMVPIDFLMTDTSLFIETGGFLPEFASKAMAEDLCLRYEQKGLKNAAVFNAEIQIDKPWQSLIKTKDHQDAAARFKEKWELVLKQPDPAYNPNFDLASSTFSLPQ